MQRKSTRPLLPRPRPFLRRNSPCGFHGQSSTQFETDTCFPDHKYRFCFRLSTPDLKDPAAKRFRLVARNPPERIRSSAAARSAFVEAPDIRQCHFSPSVGNCAEEAGKRSSRNRKACPPQKRTSRPLRYIHAPHTRSSRRWDPGFRSRTRVRFRPETNDTNCQLATALRRGSPRRVAP